AHGARPVHTAAAQDHRRADDPFAKTGGYCRASHENHARRNSCDRSPVSRRQDSAVVHARRRPGRHLHTELQGRGGGSGPHRKPTSLEGKPNGRAVHSGRATLAARDTLEIGGQMSPETIFNLHLILGYVAWLLCFRAYLQPRLKSMDQVEAHRAIATLHSFRFFGLVFILPGVVGNLPAGFATFAAYWDLATGVLAMLALLTVRIRPLFWLFVVAFNLVGVIDLVLDYYHAVRADLPALAGQLGATYAIPVIYVPVLMITHVVAFYLLLRPQPKAVRAFTVDAAAP